MSRDYIGEDRITRVATSSLAYVNLDSPHANFFYMEEENITVRFGWFLVRIWRIKFPGSKQSDNANLFLAFA